MRNVLLAATALVGLSFVPPAEAANITAFSQAAGVNTVAATDSAGNTHTQIAIVDQPLSVGELIEGSAAGARLTFFAQSIDAATTLASAVIQHYSGAFCITTQDHCGGVNILGGTFLDAAFGALGGPGLVVNANAPPDQVSLNSDIINASLLRSPAAISMAFTNLTPDLAICGTTLCEFGASFAGTISASFVPEPGPLALMGVGLLGLGLVRARRRGRWTA